MTTGSRGSGDDFVLGGAGNDVVSGEAGYDIVDGGQGDDFVGPGIGEIRGGDASDLYLVQQGDELFGFDDDFDFSETDAVLPSTPATDGFDGEGDLYGFSSGGDDWIFFAGDPLIGIIRGVSD